MRQPRNIGELADAHPLEAMRAMQCALDGAGPGYRDGEKSTQRKRAEAFICFRIVDRIPLAKALRMAREMYP